MRLFVRKDEHKFSCAHMTLFDDGTKERMHGHNFRVAAEVSFDADTKAPMLDFAKVKARLAGICSELKEHLLLPGQCQALSIERSGDEEIEFVFCGKRYVLPSEDVILLPVDNVTVERLAEFLLEHVRSALQDDLSRAHAVALAITVTEGPGQGATVECLLERPWEPNCG